MKIFVWMTLALLSGCGLFGHRKPPAPEPAEIVVTGAPLGSSVFIDGARSPLAPALADRPQVLEVAAGAHVVEIHLGDTVVYREETSVERGESVRVRVLSGSPR